MNLVGNLEDLPLSDILQIVNLSRQTGTLEITADAGLIRIVFRQGKVTDVGAPGSLTRALQLLFRRGLLEEEETLRLQREAGAGDGHWADKVLAAGLVSAPLLAQAREEWIKAEIAQLLELRAGEFVFKLQAEPAAAAPAPGVAPQAVTGQTVQLGFDARPPEPPPVPAPAADLRNTRPPVNPLPAVVSPAAPERAAGEDEPPLLAAVVVEAEAGPASQSAVAEPAPGEPASAAGAIPIDTPPFALSTPMAPGGTGSLAGFPVGLSLGDLALADAVHRALSAVGAKLTRLPPEQIRAWVEAAGPRAALVVDAALHGGAGLDYARAAEQLRADLAVVTLVPAGSETLLSRAAGLRRVMIRPDAARLPLGELGRHLDAFARELEAALASAPARDEMSDLAAELGAEPVQALTVRDPMSMLRALIGELKTHASAEITLLILRLAAEYLERAVLLLVTDDELFGLGGFGATGVEEPMAVLVRRIRAPLDGHPVLRRLAHDTGGWRGEMGPEHEFLTGAMGTLRPGEGVFIPVTSRGRVFALLYGDNAQSGAPIGDLFGLEIFAAQAGIAMENAQLERELEKVKKISQ